MRNDERHVTLYVWIGCGVTFAAIVVLWLFTLPLQFARIEQQTYDEPSRWETVSSPPRP